MFVGIVSEFDKHNKKIEQFYQEENNSKVNLFTVERVSLYCCDARCVYISELGLGRCFPSFQLEIPS